jgi:hypothetical protein
MRFVPDGPDIPNMLLSNWRDGNVLFLAGAGVSMPAPANLPSFRKLVLEVYKHLNDPTSPVLARATDLITGRDDMLRSCGLPAHQRVEVNLFFTSEFDRLFSSLEARLDQDAKGRFISRLVRDAVEAILRDHSGYCQGHRDLLRISTVGRAAGSMPIGEQCRIATTNFDRLFEEAWRAELDGIPRAYDARVAPRPGTYNFEGVIHLHGMVGPDSNAPGEFILSSRDFARVYLRSGVVANYVYDLVRRYSVVLVGYSADDPTMRYLMDAVGEDAALFDDMNQPYAIAGWNSDADDPNGEIYAHTWRAKNIEPILYKCRSDGERHGPLWDSLREWAEWARRDLEWVKEKLATATMVPPSASDEFTRSFVQDLLEALDVHEQGVVIEFLRDRHVPFEWIDIVLAASDFDLSAEGTEDAR